MGSNVAEAGLCAYRGPTDENSTFCTLGPFILDQIEGIDDPPGVYAGGAGTYAALGARIVAGRLSSRLVTWIVDRGIDFPPEVHSIISSWATSCIFRIDNDRKTTRARISYRPDDQRFFEYIVPRLQLDVGSLTLDQLDAAAFHLVCNPQRALQMALDLSSHGGRARDGPAQENKNPEPPVIIWEPGSDPCTPNEVIHLRSLVAHVDVFSPNTEEFAGYFRRADGSYNEREAAKCLMGCARDRASDLIVLVRHGSGGSVIHLNSSYVHLRPYYLAEDQGKVADPTGAGNAYLGALAMALIRPHGAAKELRLILESAGKLLCESQTQNLDVLVAAIIATVTASFVLEQVGVPHLDQEAMCEDFAERWNDSTLPDRISTYMARDRAYIAMQLN